MSDMYSLGAKPLGAGWGPSPVAQNYDLLGGTNPMQGFEGAGGGGIRYQPISSVPQLGNMAPTAPNTNFMGWDTPFLSTATQQGWGTPALGLAQGAMNAWMGMKQYGVAKSQLAESKRQFGLNYDAQRRTTNAQLEDRQKARVASNPNGYESVGSYMAKNGILGG